jgi:hypothetical protein
MRVTAQPRQELNSAEAAEATTPTVPSPSAGRQGRRSPTESLLEVIDENPTISQNLQTASATKILDCCLPESVRAGMEKIITDKSIPEETRRNYQEILDDPAKFKSFYDSQTDATRMALGSQDPNAHIGGNPDTNREAINRDQILEIGKQIGEQLQQNPESITASSSTSGALKVELNSNGDTVTPVPEQTQLKQPVQPAESNPPTISDNKVDLNNPVRSASSYETVQAPVQPIQGDQATIASREVLDLKTASTSEGINTRLQTEIVENTPENLASNLSQRIQVEVDRRPTETVITNQAVQTQQASLHNNDPLSQMVGTSLQGQSTSKDIYTAKTSQLITKIENLGEELRDQLQIDRTTERSLEIRAQVARESLSSSFKVLESTSNKNLRTSSVPNELSKKIQVSSQPVERDRVKAQSLTVQKEDQLTVRNINRPTANLNPQDITRLAELLRNSRQLVDRIGKTQTEALIKRLEQIPKMIDSNRLQDRSLSDKQLTRIVIRELMNTTGREDALKLLRTLRQSQMTTDSTTVERSIKQTQSPVVTEQISRQIASRVAVAANQKDISRLTQMLRTNEALTKKYGIETIQNLSKRLEQLVQDPTKLDRQKFKALIKEIRESLGKDGDKLIKQLYRDIQLRNNLNDRSLQARQLEVRVSVERTERILSAMRLNNLQMSSLPNALQRLIAVYLMQQIAQYRTAQDLIAMVEEVNAEWAAMLKEKDIEMLLRAGIEVADSDAGNPRRKRRVVSRSIPQDISDKRRVIGSGKKQVATEGITATSKNAAKIGQNVKAETSSPIAELIISRVKSDDKKPKESDE